MTRAGRSKIVRDVWRERTRTGFVVLAMAVGLTSFVSVLATYAVLTRELNAGYLTTNPASAVLVTDAIDAPLLQQVIARDDVADADARAQIVGRLRTPGGERRLVLFVVRDFTQLRIATVTHDSGAWPPARGDVLIERDAFQVARAEIGATVTVQIGGVEHRLRVAGGVHDAGQAQARMENRVYGYITPDTLARLTGSPALDRLLITVSGDRFDAAHVTAVANAVKTSLETSGHPVTSVIVPPPGQHPHAAIMGVLLLGMSAFGLLALVLSGVITATLLLAMMAAERRQIAVMNAIGGSAWQVAAIYLAEAAMLGITAIAVGLPAGRIGARVLSDRFARLLNFDLVNRAVPLWVDGLAIAIGLLVPLVAAAWPVESAVRVSVREGLAPIVSDPMRGWQRQLARLLPLGHTTRPWLLGMRNSLRRPVRTSLTLGTLTLAGAFFITAVSVRASMMASIDRLFGAGTFGSASRYALDQHMLMIYVFLLVAASIIAMVGGLGLMTVMSLNVLERRRELGVLRAIGATPAVTAANIAAEAAAIAVAAWLLAIGIAWPLTALVLRAMTTLLFRRGFEPFLSPLGVGLWFVLSLVLAAIASLAPAITASRRSIQEAVSYE